MPIKGRKEPPGEHFHAYWVAFLVVHYDSRETICRLTARGKQQETVLCSSELIAKINDEPWKLSSDDET